MPDAPGLAAGCDSVSTAPVQGDAGKAGHSPAAELHWLAIPGWAEDSRPWEAVGRYLPAGNQLTALTLPGSGGSRRPPPKKLDTLLEALADELAEIEAERRALCGNCSGAALALAAALRAGLPLRRLVLVDCFAAMPPYFELLLRPLYGPLCFSAAFGNPLGRLITNLVLSPYRRPGTDIMAAFARGNPVWQHHYLRLFSALGRLEDHDLSTLDCPLVDFVYGARSFAAVRAAVPQWQAQMPGLRLHELAGVGHLAVQEAPQQIAAILAGGG